MIADSPAPAEGQSSRRPAARPRDEDATAPASAGPQRPDGFIEARASAASDGWRAEGHGAASLVDADALDPASGWSRPLRTLSTMSIRTKIFLACLSLTFMTLWVGLLSQNTQGQLSDTALGIYDNAFIPMSYLRSAQSIVLGISRDVAMGETRDAIFVDQLQSVLDALDVAHERAMSPRGEACTRQLQAAVGDLQTRIKQQARPPTRQQFIEVEEKFDRAVQIYTADGFRLRGSVQALVEQTRIQTYAAIVGSIVTACFITLLLSRAIVPSIRHAVSIASAIAGGHLDNRITSRGSSETRNLMTALATMQASIAEKIAFIEALMERQASSHAAEIASQHARFEAALNNMTLGLCMFDAEGTLVVHNRRFEEMFVPPGEAADIVGVLARLGLGGPPESAEQRQGSRSFSRSLEDGRTISVSAEPMEGGGCVVTYEDVTERHLAEARLSHMVRHDVLTGLPNRVLFREHVELGAMKARSGGVLAVLCLDLDRFKTVNDTLGHPIGDALLQGAAARLLETTLATDTVVRLGGDEFAIIRYSAERDDGVRVLAERVIKALSLPFKIEGHHISIGVSIGIAETVDGTESPDVLLKNADLALYLAKANGRSTYRFFRQELDEDLQARRRLELDLRAAIDGQQFELLYQPLLNTRTGVIVAFEALLRWHHPEHGAISPARFIPVAEDAGLIDELGLWVLNKACSDAMEWPSDIKVAINLSPLQFRSSSLVDDVAAALHRSGLSAGRVEIEITESLMLQDTEVTLGILHDLRALGICISMDDFGTGYSSLSYLRRFPFDKIKVDQSFTRDLAVGSDELAIVSAVIGLGRSLRMSVVAEGVETNEQMDLLCRAGCQEVQGYLFSRPQPASAVRDLIRRFKIDRVA